MGNLPISLKIGANICNGMMAHLGNLGRRAIGASPRHIGDAQRRDGLPARQARIFAGLHPAG
jgi:hypothetical protein